MAKKNVLNRKMFAQNRLNLQDGIQMPDGTILMPPIVITPDEDLPEGIGQDGTSTSDYLGFDPNQRRIIDRSFPQKGDYGTFKGLSPTFTRESSDYTQGDDRQVDDPEIIRRNIEKTMIPQGGDVTPQGGFPDMSAGRVPPNIPQGGDVTPQGGFPDMSVGRVPPTIPQSLGDVGTFQNMNPNFNQGQVQSTQVFISNIPFRQDRVITPGVSIGVSNPNQSITSESISGAGAISGSGDEIASGTGDGMSGSTGDGSGYMLEGIDIKARKESPPPPPPQSGPSLIGQIAPAAALTALGASFAKNVGGSDEDPVKELREIAQSLRGSTMPLNMPVFRSEGSPPFGEGLADSSQRFFGGKFPTFSGLGRDNPLILKSDKLDPSRENMFRLLYEKFFGTTPKEEVSEEVSVGQRTGDPQTVGVQGPINLAQTSQNIKTDVGDILDDSEKSDPESDQKQDGKKDLYENMLALLQGDITKKTPKDFKTRVKERTTLYKDILGMDDNERKMNAYLVLAQAAANVAKSAGKNRKVLDVLSEGLQTLPLGLAKARAAERKEDLAIGTAAISAEEAIDTASAKAQADFAKLVRGEFVKAQFKSPSDKVKAGALVAKAENDPKSLTIEDLSNLQAYGVLDTYPKTGELLLPISKRFVKMSSQAQPTKEFLKTIPDFNSEVYDANGTAAFVPGGQPVLGEDTRDDLLAALTKEKLILDKLNQVVGKGVGGLSDAYGPGAAFSRMSSTLLVPFFGNVDIPGVRAKRLLDVADVQEVKNLLKQSKYAERPGGRLLRAEYEDIEKELSNFNTGILTDPTVMLNNLNQFRRKLVNNILINHSKLTGATLPLLKQIPTGTESDPLSLSDAINNNFVRDVLQNAPSKVFVQYQDANGRLQVESMSSSQLLQLIGK